MSVEGGIVYDSARDTIEHISQVGYLLETVIADLQHRAEHHDASKLRYPEKQAFDALGPATGQFGDEAYYRRLETIWPALQHHYRLNSHHPQHYPNGVAGMSLLDLIEMLCDWKATSDAQGADFAESMRICGERFSIRADLMGILRHTASDLGFFR